MAKKKTRRSVAEGKTKGEVATSQDGMVEHVQKAPCSVEISRDAKGVLRWGIKLYGELDDMDTVLDKALALDGRLKEARDGGEA